MSRSADLRQPARNYLLAALPPLEYAELLPRVEIVLARFREVIHEPGEPIRHVYFPISGVISLVALLADGTMAEVATVGNEGMIGLPIFWETESMNWRAFAQVPGNAFRLRADLFREIVGQSPALRRILQRYTQALLQQVAQSAVCNRFHPVHERCARWLMMTHDRVGSEHFSLTQDLLATMLGVRRATVSVAAATLQQRGLIRYRRGNIVVLDPDGLRDAACECYETVRTEYVRLIGTASAG